MSNSTREQLPVSRRQALKTLLAASGAITLATLPEQWQSPIIEVGVLPAFAQASPAFTISNLTRTLAGTVNNCITGNGSGSLSNVSFVYNDLGGNVTLASAITYSGTVPGAPPTFTLNDPSVVVSGNEFSGTITIQFCTRFGSATSLTETVRLTNAQGINSNTLTLITPKPIGTQEEDEIGSQSLS